MPRRRIDRFLNEVLEEFSHWLKLNEWRGKEHDCINLFAHKFLFEKIEPGAAIEHPTQISIECGLMQPKKFANKAARKDLVIWKNPLQNSWSKDWEAVNTPKAVMEWKVYRSKFPKKIFDTHDEDWISSYTEEHGDRFGYVVSVDISSEQPKVYWKHSKKGLFSKTFCI